MLSARGPIRPNIYRTSFSSAVGRINSKKNLAVFPSKGFTDHSLALNLLSLEKVDSDGNVTDKADILKKRLVTPEAPTPEHVGNPSDALAVTIDARGGVDIDFLADLMETDIPTALERLGDLVVADPDDPSHIMTADEYLSGDVGGKLEHVRELLEAERGAQLVFVDSSTPASGRWNIQDDVRRRLIEAGVPESEIACVTDAKGKSKQKEALYEKVRSGDIRILLGSTTTLGTGTNVQTRLAAIHDLDCPWRPSDLEQRLGRIVRQGNGFDHVHDFRYVSTGTFDSYLYSIVERKQRFISQVFTNKSPVRTMDDLDETVLSLAQMKQIAEGDPTVAERMDVENKIGQLKLMMASHLEGLADVQHKIETQYRPLVEALTSQRDMLADDEIPFAEADLVRQQTLGSKDSSLTVGGTHIADKEEAIRALRRAAYGVRPGCEEIIGTYRGLSVVCRRQRVLDDDWLPYIGLAVDAAKHVHMSDRVFPSGEKGAFTVLTQMDRIIARDAKGPAEIELKLREAQHALADAQKAAREPFPKQAELDEAEQRLAVLEQERIEAEAQRQREQAQRAEAEAAAIEEGVEDEREAEREHERAAAADDVAREAARVAELRRQGLICEDSATHDAATASPNGIASGGPDDVYEAARRSAAASVREELDGGEKHKAGM